MFLNSLLFNCDASQLAEYLKMQPCYPTVLISLLFDL